MRVFIFAAFFGLSASISLAQGEKKPESKKEYPAIGPVEIDFSPLPLKEVQGCGVHYNFHSESNMGVVGAIIVRNETVTQVRDMVKESLAEDGWAVRAVGKDKLQVLNYKRSPLIQAEVTVNLFGQKSKKDPNPIVKQMRRLES
jgi:nitrogen regulatory protein PII-like uncharacterized protein